MAEMRRQTAQLCGEMLATIDGTGNVHQKTLNRLLRFIERFRELNFADDREMEIELERARTELLSRTAGESRENAAAETSLVLGLERLRARGRELASQDPVELVQSLRADGPQALRPGVVKVQRNVGYGAAWGHSCAVLCSRAQPFTVRRTDPPQAPGIGRYRAVWRTTRIARRGTDGNSGRHPPS
ncbi:MAG: hypothetical protein JXA57_05360 [Armatimonadetes bacterium]|nr:hypothetical protein [Armatimonadota bacterium]